MQLQVRAIRSRSGEGLDGAIIIVLLGLAYSFETVVPAGTAMGGYFEGHGGPSMRPLASCKVGRAGFFVNIIYGARRLLIRDNISTSPSSLCSWGASSLFWATSSSP